MTDLEQRLLPRPAQLTPRTDLWAVPDRVGFTIEAPDPQHRRLARRLRDVLRRSGLEAAHRPSSDADLLLRIGGPAAAPGSLEAQAYRLEIRSRGARIEAAGEAGLLHGVTTLAQWLRLHRAAGSPLEVPGIEVVDRPSLRTRGVLLDISRDQVPTLPHLRRLVDRLADWKINQLQLYMEHTFAYRGHERVWRGAGALTAAQVRHLDGLCHDRGIELVPNQNSFGHFHRWLVHEPYRQLAECPDGIEHPFSRRIEPFSLCATDPRSLELLGELYDQLLPCFRSRNLNVGLDETFDLGQCRSAAACAERGRQAVYLEFVRAVRDLAARRGRRIQMWGDILLEHPEVIGDLPHDVTVLAWGYEADHPFADQAQLLEGVGAAHLLCPGTSSWMSFAGRTTNALENLASATRAAASHGAEGVLICDWGDRGHLQPWTASLAGLVAGAAFSWRAEDAECPDRLPIGALLDRHAFDAPERGLGVLVTGLGDTYRHTGTRAFNSSPLFHLLASPDDTLAHTRYRGLDEAHLDDAAQTIDNVRTALPALPRGGDPLARAELAWSTGAMLLAVDLGRARLGTGRDTALGAVAADQRRGLAKRLDALIDERRALWLARNRSGGLRNALAELRRTARLLRAQTAAEI